MSLYIVRLLTESQFLTGIMLINLLYGYIIMLKITIIIIILVVSLIMCCVSRKRMHINSKIAKKLLRIPYSSEYMKSNKDCAICTTQFEENQQIITLPCDPRHYFHEACIRDWLDIRSSCPICRTNIN